MTRADGRDDDELRPIKFTRHWQDHPAGSVLVEFGRTRVLCAASASVGVPRWRKDSGLGWVTAEYAMLPSAARADVAWMRREGFAFEKDGDFNGDGRPDRALAGVYRDKAGRTGRFLLVLERQGDKWRKAFLHTEPGTPGFSIVTGPPGEVHWGTCMECDAGAVLRPRGRTYAFEKGRAD